MALNKREKILALGVGVVGVILAVDLLVIEPFLAEAEGLAKLCSGDASEKNTAGQLRIDEKELKEKWAARRKDGLAEDPKDAERQVLGALKDWAGETGVVIASVRPDYVESKKEIREIMVSASASGSNEAMIKFLFKLQTAKFPVRVTEFKLGARADSDELALQLKISTLYLVPEKKENGAAKKDAGKKVAKE